MRIVSAPGAHWSVALAGEDGDPRVGETPPCVIAAAMYYAAAATAAR
ncbi:MAG: hypothetical protein AMXMBFR59_01770 [Rhodanobacteraceae bacterium]